MVLILRVLDGCCNLSQSNRLATRCEFLRRCAAHGWVGPANLDAANSRFLAASGDRIALKQMTGYGYT